MWLTLTRSLNGPPYGQIKTLTLYSDSNPNPNEKFDKLPYIAIVVYNVYQDRSSFLPTTFQEAFNITSCGVIRNQRSKIRRLKMMSTSGSPFRKILKFECRVE